MQERVESSVTESFIEHQPLEHWLINTTAFHNAHLLRRCLPRSVWAPVPMFTPADRLIKHNELAARLRDNHSKRKTAATEGDGVVPTKKRKRAEGKQKAAAPKKRGRPPKKAKKSTVSGDDSEPGAMDSDRDTNAPKKRGRGRPPQWQVIAANSSSDEDSSDTEDEAHARKKPRTRRRRDVSDSDSEYGGEREEPAQTNAPRTSGRVRRPTARAQGLDIDPEDSL